VRAKNLGEKARAAQIFRLTAAIALPVMTLIYIGLAAAAAAVTDTDVASLISLLRDGLLLFTMLLCVFASIYFVHQVMSWATTDSSPMALVVVRRKTVWLIVSLAGLLIYVLTLVLDLAYTNDKTPTVWLGMTSV